MARKALKLETIRALFAHSGNRCAFPNCFQKLINHKNQFIGNVCHIEAAEEGAERYNKNSSDEERRSYGNLLLLCYPHHIETNDTEEFKVEKLKQIKSQHEKIFQCKPFDANESILSNIVNDLSKYWEKIEKLNKIEHFFRDFAIDINTNDTFSDLMNEITDTIINLENGTDFLHESDEKLEKDFNFILKMKSIDPRIFDDIPYYENPFINRNWETHNLSIRNNLSLLQTKLVHLEVKYWSEYLQNNSDSNANIAFEKAKLKLEELAQSALYAD